MISSSTYKFSLLYHSDRIHEKSHFSVILMRRTAMDAPCVRPRSGEEIKLFFLLLTKVCWEQELFFRRLPEIFPIVLTEVRRSFSDRLLASSLKFSNVFRSDMPENPRFATTDLCVKIYRKRWIRAFGNERFDGPSNKFWHTAMLIQCVFPQPFHLPPHSEKTNGLLRFHFT